MYNGHMPGGGGEGGGSLNFCIMQTFVSVLTAHVRMDTNNSGLSKTELNGSRGVVEGYFVENGRRVVRVTSDEGPEKAIKVKPANIRCTLPVARDGGGEVQDRSSVLSSAKQFRMVDVQDRMGTTALWCAMNTGTGNNGNETYDVVKFLVETHGASVHILGFGGESPLSLSHRCSQDVQEVITVAASRPHCGSCGATGNDMLVCARCKTQSYCTRQCQKIHWKLHKPECKPAKSGKGSGGKGAKTCKGSRAASEATEDNRDVDAGTPIMNPCFMNMPMDFKSPTSLGRRVELHGLSRQDLNGLSGVIIEDDTDAAAPPTTVQPRVTVRLDCGKTVAVKIKNMKLAATRADYTLASPEDRHVDVTVPDMSVPIAVFGDDGDDCVVCMDKLGTANSNALPRCGHRFHAHCIQKWFALTKANPEIGTAQCPICKTHNADTKKEQRGVININANNGRVYMNCPTASDSVHAFEKNHPFIIKVQIPIGMSNSGKRQPLKMYDHRKRLDIFVERSLSPPPMFRSTFAGPNAGEGICSEAGYRALVTSVQAHGTGRGEQSWGGVNGQNTRGYCQAVVLSCEVVRIFTDRVYERQPW